MNLVLIFNLCRLILLNFWLGYTPGQGHVLYFIVHLGEYKKDELLEAARSGNEEKLMSLLTPLNVNCHASDGRKSTPLHLAAGYNRTRIVQLLLQQGADVHAKDKG